MIKKIKVIRKKGEKMDAVYVINGVYSEGKASTYSFDIYIDGEFYVHIPAESGYHVRDIPNAMIQKLEITLLKEKIKVYSDWIDKYTSLHSLKVEYNRDEWIKLDHSKGGWEYPYNQDEVFFSIESPTNELDAEKYYDPIGGCKTTEIFGDFQDSHTIKITEIKIVNHFKTLK